MTNFEFFTDHRLINCEIMSKIKRYLPAQKTGGEGDVNLEICKKEIEKGLGKLKYEDQDV